MSRRTISSPHTALYRYWADCRGARVMPARADLDPLAMKSFLPHLMLFDVLGDRFRYRLVGTQVVRDFGRDTTGTFLGGNNPQQPFSADVTGIFVRVRDGGMPLFTVGHHQTAEGVTHSVSRLLLPLGRDDRVNMILLCRLARYTRPQDAAAGWDTSTQVAQSEIIEIGSEAEVRHLADRWEAQSDAIATDPQDRLSRSR